MVLDIELWSDESRGKRQLRTLMGFLLSMFKSASIRYKTSFSTMKFLFFFGVKGAGLGTRV